VGNARPILRADPCARADPSRSYRTQNTPPCY
jgi:hypothetical protein